MKPIPNIICIAVAGLTLGCFALAQVAQAGPGTSTSKNVNVVNTPNVNVANTPSVSVSNTPNVNVANTPTVQDRDNPARQPFQASFTVGFPIGSFQATETITVPAAKRFVIEYISVGPGRDLTQVTITTIVNGNGALSTLMLLQQPNQEFFPATFLGASQTVRLYADPGTSVSCKIFRSTNIDFIALPLMISGYLVDVP